MGLTVRPHGEDVHLTPTWTRAQLAGERDDAVAAGEGREGSTSRQDNKTGAHGAEHARRTVQHKPSLPVHA
jgi:hypothetical protein